MKRFLFLLLVLVAFISCDTAMSSDDSPSRNVVTGEGLPSLGLFGDSRTALWPTLDTYFPSWAVYNSGVGGTTSVQAAYRIAGINEHYDVIIISTGINDYCKGMTFNESIFALQSCISWAKVKADTVFITTVPGLCLPSALSWVEVSDFSYRAAQLNTYIPTLAANAGIGCIDIAATLRNPGAIWYLNPLYADSSGIHYNVAGYDRLAVLYNTRLTPLLL